MAWYDNRGLGESDVPTGPYSAALMAGDALAVLDAAGFDRAHVLGTSLGGMVAQELAFAHPERIEKLVLACTTPGGPDAFPMPQRSVEAIARFPLLPPEEGYRLVVENALSDASVADRPELVEELVAYRLSHQPPMDGWLAQAAAGMTFDSAGRLGRSACRRSSSTAPATTSSTTATRSCWPMRSRARASSSSRGSAISTSGRSPSGRPLGARVPAVSGIHTIDRWLRDRARLRRRASRSSTRTASSRTASSRSAPTGSPSRCSRTG